jgi:hypothetical protein
MTRWKTIFKELQKRISNKHMRRFSTSLFIMEIENE